MSAIQRKSISSLLKKIDEHLMNMHSVAEMESSSQVVVRDAMLRFVHAMSLAENFEHGKYCCPLKAFADLKIVCYDISRIRLSQRLRQHRNLWNDLVSHREELAKVFNLQPYVVQRGNAVRVLESSLSDIDTDKIANYNKFDSHIKKMDKLQTQLNAVRPTCKSCIRQGNFWKIIKCVAWAIPIILALSVLTNFGDIENSLAVKGYKKLCELRTNKEAKLSMRHADDAKPVENDREKQER